MCNKILLTIIILLVNTFSLYSQKAFTVNQLRDMSLEELMNIEVTSASKLSETNLESSAIISLYNKSDLKNTGYYTLSELANITPGYSSYTIYGEKVFETRGQKSGSFNNNRHLLLLDGIPINHSRNYKVHVEEEFPLIFADKVEFIRGPASSLYGVSAFYGVVNVFTPNKVSNGTDINTRISFGNKDQNKKIASNIIHKTDKGLSKVAFGYYEKEASKEYVGIVDSEDNRFWDDQRSIFLYASHQFSADLLDGLSTGLIYLNKSGGLGEHWMAANFSHEINDLIWTNLNFFLKYIRELSKNLSLNSYIKFNESVEKGWAAPFSLTRYKEYKGTGRVFQYYNAKLRNYEGLAEVKYIKDDFSIIGGINFDSRKQLSNDDGSHGYDIYADSGDVYRKNPNFIDESDAYNTYSIFVQVKQKVSFLKGLDITLGLRNDYGEGGPDSYNQLSPRISLVQKINNMFTIKALYNTALVAPGLKEVKYNIEKERSKPEVGDIPELDAESISSAEFALYFTRPTFTLMATYFYNSTEDMITFTRDGYYNSNGNIDANGFEFEGKFKPFNEFNVFANYSFAKAEDKDGREFFDVPSQKANLGLTYYLNKFGVTGIVRWIKDYRVGDPSFDNLEGGTVADLNFLCEVSNNLSLELFIENITDEDYKHPKNGLPDVPRLSRSFTLSTGISFN